MVAKRSPTKMRSSNKRSLRSTMNSTLRLSLLVALLALASPAQAQTPVNPLEPAAARAPLNLSLPRSDVRPVSWDRFDANAKQREAEVRTESDNQGSDMYGNALQQQAPRNRGSMPYGSGFEARQRSSTGGRGMGRGR